MHQAGNIRLFNADNIELMKQAPDGYFELAIVDPPYGININNNIGRRKGDKSSDYKKVTWDDSPPTKEYFDELFRASKNQIIWGANHFVELINKNSSCWIVWDKLFSEDVSFASVELAWSSFTTVCKRLNLSSQQQGRLHPTQKPVALYKWLLQNYAKQGDKILDTHAGSFSIGIACEEMGFSLDAMELDTDYYNQSWERFERHLRQPRLFTVEQLTIESEELF